jgi:hypothetical protein
LGGVLLQDTNVGLNTFNLGINTPSPDHQFQVTGTFKNQYTDTVSGLISTLDNSSDPIGIGLPGFASTVFNPISNLTAFNLSTLDGSSMLNISGVGDLTTFSSLAVLENSVDITAGTANTYLGSGSGDGSGRINIYRDIVLGQSETRLDNSNFVSGLQSLITNNADLGVTFNFGGVDGFYTFPRIDGTANQVLTTDGLGQLSWQNASGSSGWSLTGNTGTTAGTNFIGTTDAQDFVVKTNGNQIELFGQNGNIAFGSDLTLIDPLMTAPVASNIGSMAFQSGQATGLYSTAFGVTSATGDVAMAWGNSEWGANIASGLASTVWGNGGNTASADGATAFGKQTTASGAYSTAFGLDNIASGGYSTSWGNNNYARSYVETSFGVNGTDYTPSNISNFVSTDRLFSIGNGNGIPHNAYTLFKDGSFAYNDDNFQNDNVGTEQNMFYFNYGNHDGLGVAQTNKAIRMGSIETDAWDITSGNVGDRSIAIGFANPTFFFPVTGPTASGGMSIAIGTSAFATKLGSIAIGVGSVSTGQVAVAIGGGQAEGDSSTAFGGGGGYATGQSSYAFGGLAEGGNSYVFGYATDTPGYVSTRAAGQNSYAFGGSTEALAQESFALGTDIRSLSFNEFVLGRSNTRYVPISTTNSNGLDRLFTVANGDYNSESDAFTILKNGQTGIGVDNFQANTNGNIFQVGDGTTNIIGYVDSGTGAWVAVSDARQKHNITDLIYGLDTISKLHPVSFDYNRNNEHTIGFLAQEVKDIIPEAVFGSEEKGYGMSYQVLTPALVKAIQEMNLNIIDIRNMNKSNTWRDSLIAWFESTTNGIRSLVVHDKICVDDQCLTKDDIKVLLQMKNGNTPTVPNNPVPPSTPDLTPLSDPLTCTTPQVINQAGDACVDPVIETPQIDTPFSDPLTE